MPIYCRDIAEPDLDEVVRIHAIAFPRFFLTRMGPRFLRAYYQSVLDFDSSIALLCCDGNSGAAIGFAVGFDDPSGFYELFSRRRRKLLPAIMIAVLHDPSLIGEILRSTRRVSAQARQDAPAIELSSIGVEKSGQGIGSALLDEFLTRAGNKGGTTVRLTTDAEGNDVVLGFYEKHSFHRVGHEDRGDRRLFIYERELG
jgi:ribosomal protein S18 acetylase RimI-like enzyme